MFDNDKILQVGSVLKNTERPLKERFRALFTLKNIGGLTAIKCISDCFNDESALLKHELAYCLGQMQNIEALPILIKTLEDKTQEPMVRHEAAEAIGAIGIIKSEEILKKYVEDDVIEVSETCMIALERLKWLNKENNSSSAMTEFLSIDPTPANSSNNFDEIKKVYLNEKKSLFERYCAMFSLRNMKTNESVNVLTEGFNCSSALFRHEVAFVLGQLQNPLCIPSLSERLSDLEENEMVRHECAEALGAIASDDCKKILKKFLNDNKRVVRESCEVALDMCDYENSLEFQYANTLISVS